MITLNLIAKGMEQESLKQYLEENASETLADKINNGVRIEKDGKTLINKKTLESFVDYAHEEAKKQAEKGSRYACLHSDVVFGWAIHYFEEESIIGKLYNEDGSEYKAPKPVVKKTTTAATTTYTPFVVKKPQSEQLSLFDFSGDAPVVNDTEETVEDVVEETIETVVEEQKVEPAPVVVEEDPKGSPLYQKYMAIQNQYPEHIICMRVGDFYEVFGYGAVQVSELIDLTLTSRDMGLKHRVPMVGFPYHRADVYYDKLTDKGLTLVVAENDELTVKSVTKGTVNVHTGEVIEEPAVITNNENDDNEILAIIKQIFGNELEVCLQ
ncbi:MAG: hypothetical protein IKV16_04200 [Clostridia bacterium]|nr:hypothetical protein [Clostridia bacterium]MBR5140238.1 hypothetical protein [Clostridia bacterium]